MFRDQTARIETANENPSDLLLSTSLLACSTPCQIVTPPRPSSPNLGYTELSLYRPTSFPDIQSTPHRFYLHHFIQQTAAIYFPLEPDAFLRLVIPVAENSRCMLGALLAASSSHYSRLNNNNEAHVAAIEATVHTLSSLERVLTTSATGCGTLATSLMLATTSLCGGDTFTYRKHLDGALKIVEMADISHQPDSLWPMSMRWLTQLLLMDRLSNLPQTTERELGPATWKRLLSSMPHSSQIDRTTSLSADLIRALLEICDVSEGEPKWSREEPSIDFGLRGVRSQTLLTAEKGPHTQHLEILLLKLRDDAFCKMEIDSRPPTEAECSHNLFVNATLLCLYKRVYGLPRTNPKITATVDIMMSLFQEIDENSRVNAPLLWPLLAAGCEATTDDKRRFFADRMASMATHGLGIARLC